MIRRSVTTTASTHDSRVDLSKSGETVYWDKGYFGVKPAASMDKTMHRAVRGHPLSIKEKRRNCAISRTRALVERPYAVIKRYFRAGHVLVTTVARVHLMNVFACFNYNLIQLRTIQRRTRAERYLLRSDNQSEDDRYGKDRTKRVPQKSSKVGRDPIVTSYPLMIVRVSWKRSENDYV